MSVQMIDCYQRLLPHKRKCLGCGDTDYQGNRQPGLVRNSDGIDIILTNTRLIESLPYHGIYVFDMGA